MAFSALFVSNAGYAQNVPAPDSKANPLTACTLPGVARFARCGSIIVPEDRRNPAGRKIAIRVAVLPAQNAERKNDPIVILQGGPGESAIDDASVYAQWLAPVLVDRDLLLVDQRGAGGSAPLTCKLADQRDTAVLLRESFPLSAIERCTSQLAAHADLTQYGYANFVDDLEQIRKTLGFDKLNLFAGSYGTRAAQVYLRRFPDAIRTVFFLSVVPIDLPTPITMASTAQKELDQLFDACLADARCRQAYPDLRTEFDEVMQRLRRGEAKALIEGYRSPIVMDAGPAAGWIRAKLYRPSSAAELPWAIHRAYNGDWKPIADGVASAADSNFSFGLFFAITCNEDMRFIDPAKIAPASRQTFVGDTRVRQQQAACRYWPLSPLPKNHRAPVRSKVPALFVTGEADGGTPIWFTEHAAKNFANGRILFSPGQGHTEWNPCVASRYYALVRQGRAEGKRRDSCPRIPRPAFKL
jgi:pimeloyl-ACP methyl ester carboxylesterase